MIALLLELLALLLGDPVAFGERVADGVRAVMGWERSRGSGVVHCKEGQFATIELDEEHQAVLVCSSEPGEAGQ